MKPIPILVEWKEAQTEGVIPLLNKSCVWAAPLRTWQINTKNFAAFIDVTAQKEQLMGRCYFYLFPECVFIQFAGHKHLQSSTQRNELRSFPGSVIKRKSWSLWRYFMHRSEQSLIQM